MEKCAHHNNNLNSSQKIKNPFYFFFGDIFFASTFLILIFSLTAYLFIPEKFFFIPKVYDFSKSLSHLMHKIWWGLVLSILFVGILSKVPKEFTISALGRRRGLKGILRASLLGFALDICSHGILLVGMKLYERGASLAQVIAFLLSSPWNSFSLMVILISLIGWKITLSFVLFSFLIAVLTGLGFDIFEKKGLLPPLSQKPSEMKNFNFLSEMSKQLKHAKWNFQTLKEILMLGIFESKLLLRWIFFGLILTALISSLVDPQTLRTYFGVSLLGIFLTLLVTTLIEVCSEGSAPLASELVNTAQAPGNGFVFLMAGVATDYTELMVLRQSTGSWKATLFLPLLSVPQILFIGYWMNKLY